MDTVSIGEGVGYLALASYSFLGVATLCDEHLCPALDKLCDYLKIPTSLAAVTFVSFGSSAPELIISALGAQTDKTELSIPAVLVSALIAFGAIPPLVVYAAGELKLHVRSVVRDAVAYAVALVMFIIYNQAPEISKMQAGALIGAYVVYLVVVYLTRTVPGDFTRTVSQAFIGAKAEEGCVRDNGTDKTKDHLVGHLEQKLLDTDAKDDAPSDGESEKSEEDEESGPIMSALNFPFEKAFAASIPDGPVGAFIMSMAWLCVLSYIAMVMAEGVAGSWGISDATAGITLLAWGGQLPDALAAVALAKAGKPDEAISQAISSQVINISLGIGLPILIHGYLAGPTVTENHMTILLIAMAVFVSIVFYLASITPLDLRTYRVWLNPRHKGVLNGKLCEKRAMMLAAGFVICYAGSIACAEQMNPFSFL